MAYLDLRSAELAGALAAPAFGPGPTAIAEPQPARFSAIEWLVVALAERDSLASLERPGRIAAALGRLFGGSGQARLANPELEALRRLAVLAWAYGFNVPPSELAAFRAAGFSTAQAELLLESVLARRARRGDRRRGALA